MRSPYRTGRAGLQQWLPLTRAMLPCSGERGYWGGEGDEWSVVWCYLFFLCLLPLFWFFCPHVVHYCSFWMFDESVPFPRFLSFSSFFSLISFSILLSTIHCVVAFSLFESFCSVRYLILERSVVDSKAIDQAELTKVSVLSLFFSCFAILNSLKQPKTFFLFYPAVLTVSSSPNRCVPQSYNFVECLGLTSVLACLLVPFLTDFPSLALFHLLADASRRH